jgi:hypothetical protein
MIDKDIEFVLKLESKSAKTDLISSVHFGGMCLVVSARFKSIIEETIVKYYQFIPLKLSFRGKLIEDYFLFHFVKDANFFSKLIDWNESIFKIEKLINGQIECELTHFNDWDEMIKYDFYGNIENLRLLRPKFKFKMCPETSIFNFNHYLFPSGFFCTEPFKELAETSNLSGIRFEEIDYFEMKYQLSP